MLAGLLVVSPVTEAKESHLSPDEEKAVVAAYRKLSSQDIEQKRISALPPRVVLARIDINEKLRSASFGHRTTLLVPVGGRVFYVEYGRSTNAPGGMFGPFSRR
jgi:hypothetical protein